MSRQLAAAAIAAGMSIVAVVPAVAGEYTRLARAAGLGAEAGAMSLDQIAAIKFSVEGHDNRQAYVARAVVPQDTAVVSTRTGGGMSLDAYHLDRINRSVSGEERQPVLRQAGVQSDPEARRRLAASAGISRAEFEGMTLAAIVERKIDQEDDAND